MKNNTKLIFIVLIIFCCLSSAFVYFAVIRPEMNKNVAVEYIQQTAEKTFGVPIHENTKIVQDMQYSGKISGVRLIFGTYEQKYNDGNIDFKLIEEDSGEVLQNVEIFLGSVEDNKGVDIMFDESIDLDAKKKYQIIIEPGNGYNENYNVVLWCSLQNEKEYSKNIFSNMTVDEKVEYGCVLMAFYEGDTAVNMTWVLITLLIIVIVCITYIGFVKYYPLHQVFYPLCLLGGIIYLLAVPTLGTFDEQVHMQNVLYHVSNIFEEKVDEQENLYVTKVEYVDYTSALRGWKPSKQKYAQLNQMFQKCYGKKTIEVELETGILKPSYMYLPQSIGGIAGYAFGFNLYTLTFLASITNLIFYALVVGLAIKVIPIAKELLFLLALCPTPLKAAASLSYDAFINSLAFLVIALIIKMLCSQTILIKDYIMAAIAFILISPCKMVYIFLGLLFLAVPMKSFSKKRYFASIFGVTIGAVAMFIIVHFDNILKLVQKSQGTVISPFGLEAYSYFDIFRQPKAIIKLFVFTVTRDLGNIILKAFARIQYIEYPVLLSVGMVVCIVVIFVYSSKIIIPKVSKGFIVLSTFMVSGAIFASAIAWTTKESLTLMGVQGRYFVPVLPLVFLIGKAFVGTEKGSRSIKKVSLIIFLIIQIIGVWVIFDKMMMGNYDSIVSW